LGEARDTTIVRLSIPSLGGNNTSSLLLYGLGTIGLGDTAIHEDIRNVPSKDQQGKAPQIIEPTKEQKGSIPVLAVSTTDETTERVRVPLPYT